MQTALLSYFPGMYYYMDPTYVLVIIGAVICMLAFKEYCYRVTNR